ncbi:Transcriptional activator [Vermiconidia calcicola]|uniref:Transcriptional activator n=1 Tax=Vermiconidia calcicola TaxID=1690605 RepID=A0ACC3MNZ1_9PEZI|nr:Transcriptional activator [Vermiconidia calcicola]
MIHPDDHHEVFPIEFADTLCWFLHAEGFEEYVWRWIQVDAKLNKEAFGKKALYTHSKALTSQHRSPRLLTGIINAHLIWAKDGTVDSAIKQFQRAHRAFWEGSESKELVGTVPFIGPQMEIKRAVSAHNSPPGDPALFENFLSRSSSTLGRSKEGQLFLDREFADISLHHPTRPDPTPLLNPAKEQYGNPAGELLLTVFAHDSSSVYMHYGTSLSRAAYILRLQDRLTDAEWLESIVDREWPTITAYRAKDYARWFRDPKLLHLAAVCNNGSLRSACEVRNMAGPLSLAFSALLVIAACIQLVMALRRKYVRSFYDTGKDAHVVAAELEAQLQGELQEAIELAHPSGIFGSKNEREDSLAAPTVTTPRVTFATDLGERIFEDISSVERNGSPRNAVRANSDADHAMEEAAASHHDDTTLKQPESDFQIQRTTFASTGSVEQQRALHINPKQFHRILKRRMARQMIEQLLNSHSRKGFSQTATGCMRRPRGSGGRFLTEEEIKALDEKRFANAATGEKP